MAAPTAMTAPPATTAPAWLRRLALAIVVLASAEFLVATVGVQIQRLPERTDFASFYLAGTLAREGRSPYDPRLLAEAGHVLGLAHDQYPFLYAPPFLVVVEPLARLSYPRARQVWMLLSAAALFAALAVTAHLVRRMAAALGLEDPRAPWVLLAAFVPAALNASSVHNDLRSGSVGEFLLLAFAVAAWALLERRSAWTGAALAAASLLKVVPVALVPWAGWRGAHRAAGMAAGILTVLAIAAGVRYGFAIYDDWVRHAVVTPLVTPNGWAHNQSLDAYLLRLFSRSAVVAVPDHVPVLQRLLSLVVSIGVAGVTIRALGDARRAAPEDPRVADARLPLELGAAVLALLVLMKIAWVHTLSAMLFVWPALMVVIWRAAERGAPWARRAGVAACAGFFLSSAHLPILWGERLQEPPWLWLTGAHLAGLLLLWGTVLFVLRRSR